MPTLRFTGPSHRLVPEPDTAPDLVVERGDTFDCSDERAEEHLTSPHYECRDVAEEADSLRGRTRPDLDELAAQAGVANPVDLPNKDAVIAAIKEAEAASGEGPEDNPDKEG